MVVNAPERSEVGKLAGETGRSDAEECVLWLDGEVLRFGGIVRFRGGEFVSLPRRAMDPSRSAISCSRLRLILRCSASWTAASTASLVASRKATCRGDLRARAAMSPTDLRASPPPTSRDRARLARSATLLYPRVPGTVRVDELDKNLIPARGFFQHRRVSKVQSLLQSSSVVVVDRAGVQGAGELKLCYPAVSAIADLLRLKA